MRVYLYRGGSPPRGGGAVPGTDERALRPGVCCSTAGGYVYTCILLLHIYLYTHSMYNTYSLYSALNVHIPL